MRLSELSAWYCLLLFASIGYVPLSWTLRRWGQTLTLFRKGSVPSFRTRGGCCWLCCHIVICTQSKGEEAFLRNSLRRSPNTAGRDPSFFWRAFTKSTRIGQSACKDWSNWGCCLTSDSVHHLKQHLSHILSCWQKSTNWRWFGQGNQEGADFFRCDVAFAVLWNAPLHHCLRCRRMSWKGRQKSCYTLQRSFMATMAEKQIQI